MNNNKQQRQPLKITISQLKRLIREELSDASVPSDALFAVVLEPVAGREPLVCGVFTDKDKAQQEAGKLQRTMSDGDAYVCWIKPNVAEADRQWHKTKLPAITTEGGLDRYERHEYEACPPHSPEEQPSGHPVVCRRCQEKLCPNCDGEGYVRSTGKVCVVCNGDCLW